MLLEVSIWLSTSFLAIAAAYSLVRCRRPQPEPFHSSSTSLPDFSGELFTRHQQAIEALSKMLRDRTESPHHRAFISSAQLSEDTLEMRHPQLGPIPRPAVSDIDSLRSLVLEQLLSSLGTPSISQTVRHWHCDLPHVYQPRHRIRLYFEAPEDEKFRYWGHCFLTTNFDSILESAFQFQTALAKPIFWEFPIISESVRRALKVAFMIYEQDRLEDDEVDPNTRLAGYSKALKLGRRQ